MEQDVNAKVLAEEYLGQIARLRNAVSGMSHQQLLARPVAGKMSTLEVVCHLSDFEPIYVDRLKRVLSHDKPLLLAADENLFLTKLNYHERDIEEELALIEATRKSFAHQLTTLSPDDLTRKGVHSERGLITAEELVNNAIGHINHHLPFIIEKRRALGI